MQAIREYVLGIAAAAMICAVVLCFARKGTMEPLLKLICGLVLTFAVVKPLLSISMGHWEDLNIICQKEGEKAAQAGTELAKKTLRDIIIADTQAYILDKAQEMALSIQVTVDLSKDEPPVPESVTITGALSPYERSCLGNFMEKELGITKERQQWNSKD